MSTLLQANLVPFHAIADTVEGVVSSVELKGPAVMSDSVSSWWIIVLRLRATENPAVFNHTANRVLHWLLTKWSPGKPSAPKDIAIAD
jgi:serine-protein kinase ATM